VSTLQRCDELFATGGFRNLFLHASLLMIDGQRDIDVRGLGRVW
jgi:hypothetical protein